MSNSPVFRSRMSDDLKSLHDTLMEHLPTLGDQSLRIARKLHNQEVTPEKLETILRLLSESKSILPQIITSSDYAGIKLLYLDRWIRSGIITPDDQYANTSTKTQQKNRTNKWILAKYNRGWTTEARQYVNAAKGDQKLASHAAEAKIPATEIPRLIEEGIFTEAHIENMLILRNLAE